MESIAGKSIRELTISHLSSEEACIQFFIEAYNELSEYGYIHLTVNHSQNFVDRQDRFIHTQNIENIWRWAKNRFLSTTKNTEKRLSKISEHLFRKNSKINDADLLYFYPFVGADTFDTNEGFSIHMNLFSNKQEISWNDLKFIITLWPKVKEARKELRDCVIVNIRQQNQNILKGISGERTLCIRNFKEVRIEEQSDLTHSIF
ncbi:hypothetical protein RF11_11082 [Thelohanellus kitauei]|uniref:Uncharacterized protein n=1 Tax=Thelohanellus kitauei TaxID=669202 RepID=A0A0C2N674_THEKT|nr:hypothetical protein RF11_11082 [Thelohanellus kitauei]